MSAPSARLLKDSSAGAGQRPSSGRKPSKALTPVSISGNNPSSALQKSSSGKENPRPSYRAFGSTQKPVIRPVPRVEKSAAGGGSDSEARVRCSSTTRPRGRSPSPSEFIRVFSDLRREKGSRITGEKSELGSGKNASVTRNSGVKRIENENKFPHVSIKSSRRFEETEQESKIKTNLGSDSVKDSGFEGPSIVKSSNSDSKTHIFHVCGEKSAIASKSDSKSENTGRVTNPGSRRTSLDNSGKVSDMLKEKGGSEGSNRIMNKYPSKLHEKLAFLEGKVKRIASDIKKTKDMLDLNNPDESKLILSDIQEKISGVEKAMSHVVSDTDDQKNVPRTSDNEEKKESDNKENNQVAKVKPLVTGLNSEELENRLFPHQKLLRDRTQSKASLEGKRCHFQSNLVEPNEETNVEIKSLNPADENAIALEFLASLEKGNPKVTIRSDESDLNNSEVQEMDADETSRKQDASSHINLKSNFDEILAADEALEDFDDEGNKEEVELEEIEDAFTYKLNEIGSKTSTGGWFVSEGEAVLLAHDDGSCSYYDVANCEVKSVYNPPNGMSRNTWRDCWVVRAPGADGCSGRYVVAASAGNTLDSGFCSWDFYTKDIKASHFEDGAAIATSRTVLAPISNNMSYGRSTLACSLEPEAQQWWYKPCGPLIISTASSQKVVKVFDIRDGEQIMRWEVQKPVSAIDYSSPLQWRNRGKVVIAEAESISVWDVNSLHPEAHLTISSSGRKISAIHINNTDAEFGGGVRQRVSSSEAEGNDGVFCTTDSINILDFRHPSGIGAKIPKLGVNAQCVSSRGDSIFLGSSSLRSTVKKNLTSQVQQFSLRKQRLVSTYSLPESISHPHHSAITQVWGNSNLVMAVSGMGLFVFDSAKDETLQNLTGGYGTLQNVRETIGPDDLYSPSFDYLGSRVLLISRDRPALWRHFI